MYPVYYFVDNLFVLYDAWVQSSACGTAVNVTMLSKASFSFRRASSAMSVTTITTFFAFVSTALSIIPAVSSFGIFSAIMIAFCFILTLTWFFAGLMFYEKSIKYRNKPVPEWHPKYVTTTIKSVELSEISASGTSGATSTDTKTIEITTPASAPMAVVNDVESQKQTESGEEFDPSKLMRTEKFYYFKLSKWIYNARKYILVLSLICLVVFGYLTSLVEQGTENPDPLPKDSLEGKARNYMLTELRASGAVSSTVSVTWGVSDIDRSGVDPNDQERKGTVVFDSTFRYG